jgi:ankyrin repeat protein
LIRKIKKALSALHSAVITDNIEIAKLLLENKANVNIKDSYGNTPLWRASHMNPKIIKLLLDYGADYNIKNNYDVSLLTLFQAYPDIIKLFKKYGKK